MPIEKPELGKLVIGSIVVFLGTLAFSCSVAAEFKKVKVMMAGKRSTRSVLDCYGVAPRLNCMSGFFFCRRKI